MEIHSAKIEINKIVGKVSGETTRLEIINLFGLPDDVGGFSQKKKRGKILKGIKGSDSLIKSKIKSGSENNIR